MKLILRVDGKLIVKGNSFGSAESLNKGNFLYCGFILGIISKSSTGILKDW